MNLRDYRDLIRQMPVATHAFTCSRENWATHVKGNSSTFDRAFRKLFDQESTITQSRSDLRNHAGAKRLDVFALATLLWGYPAGMRGTHASDIRDDFPALVKLLEDSRADHLDSWEAHCARLDKIRGVGISTYSKFLSFLSIRIDGNPAMIFDTKIARVAQSVAFSDLEPIRHISYEKGLKHYPVYLQWIHTASAELDVPTENLEFFLFEFGGSLKAP